MRRVSVGLLVAALCAASLQADPRRIDPKAYLEHVKFLASEDLEGRGNGSRGLESAAEYIAAQFREAGLEPAGDAARSFSASKDDGDVGGAGNSVTCIPVEVRCVRRGTRLRDRVDVGQSDVRRRDIASRLRRLRYFSTGASL